MTMISKQHILVLEINQLGSYSKFFLLRNYCTYFHYLKSKEYLKHLKRIINNYYPILSKSVVCIRFHIYSKTIYCNQGK